MRADGSRLADASTEDLIDYGTHDEATRLAAPSPPSENVPAATAVTYVDFDDPFNFFDGASGAPHLAGLSPNAWVGCGGDVFVLELLGRGHVRVERVADAGEEGSPAFKGYYVPAALDKGTARGLKISPFLRARQVLTADDLRTALRSCDAYVEKKVLPGQLYSGYAPLPSLLPSH
jgi:ATP-dependent helicase IRC3